jgi:hypothetical protein
MWRRGRDSNPRRAFTLNGFRDRPIQPLSHLSAGLFLQEAEEVSTGSDALQDLRGDEAHRVHDIVGAPPQGPRSAARFTFDGPPRRAGIRRVFHSRRAAPQGRRPPRVPHLPGSERDLVSADSRQARVAGSRTSATSSAGAGGPTLAWREFTVCDTDSRTAEVGGQSNSYRTEFQVGQRSGRQAAQLVPHRVRGWARRPDDGPPNSYRTEFQVGTPPGRQAA